MSVVQGCLSGWEQVSLIVIYTVPFKWQPRPGPLNKLNFLLQSLPPIRNQSNRKKKKKKEQPSASNKDNVSKGYISSNQCNIRLAKLKQKIYVQETWYSIKSITLLLREERVTMYHWFWEIITALSELWISLCQDSNRIVKVLVFSWSFSRRDWTWDRHFKWSSEPREGLADCRAKAVTSSKVIWRLRVRVRTLGSSQETPARRTSALPT